MLLQLKDIRAAMEKCPGEYISRCEREYKETVRCAAMAVAVSSSPIVLLAGPSGSGKTTTARLIAQALMALGIKCHFVSMDDYFLNVDPATTPRTETGEYDFESSECVDMALLSEHFDALERGESIEIPRFNFFAQKRDGVSRVLTFGKNDMVIFEGIHAFDPFITRRHEKAVKILVSAMDTVMDGEEELFSPRDTRLVRRIVRDSHSRGNGPAQSLKLWNNVIRSEDRALSRSWGQANITVNTTHAYEFCIFADTAPKVLSAVDKENEEYGRAERLREKLLKFPPVQEDHVPKDSLLREFIGEI